MIEPMTLVCEEPTDVLANANITYSLLNGAGATVTLAAAGATWRLMHTRRSEHRTHRQAEADEVATLRSIIDNVMLFLVGRQGHDGLPDTAGFVDQFQDFRADVLGELAELRRLVERQGGGNHRAPSGP